jgi:RNA polymerase sigma factor (sigma-70 family)
MIRGKAPAPARIAWTDEQLVKACLGGDEEAWSALIDKYKRLIHSIPIKYGLPPDDASEIFQQVCLRLLSELPNVRDPKSLGGWLIKVTSHKCFEWARRERLHGRVEVEIDDTNPLPPSANPDEVLLQVEREQLLREALLEITPRCRQLIHMLFYETPSVPYEEVAKNLRLATGSIGFVRMRCLKQLRRRLKERGFR